jgi:hypothetical protein
MNTGIGIAGGLIILAIALFMGVRRGLISNDTLATMADVAGIVALIAAAVVFILPTFQNPVNGTPTATLTQIFIPTHTNTFTITPSNTPSPTATPTFTVTPTFTSTPSQTPPPTNTGTPTPTYTPTPNCHPSYPTLCLPPPPPDIDCKFIPLFRNFPVLPPDPHNLDVDGDGIGCEE